MRNPGKNPRLSRPWNKIANPFPSRSRRKRKCPGASLTSVRRASRETPSGGFGDKKEVMRSKLHTTSAKCKICGVDGKPVASRKSAPTMGLNRIRRKKVSFRGISCSGTSTATWNTRACERYRAQRGAVAGRVRRRARAPADTSCHKGACCA